MNKFAAAAATAALMLSLSAGALAASGLGSVTSMSGSEAAADKAGSVTVNTTMRAGAGRRGKITAVSFDIAQNKVGFDATGALTGELTGEHPPRRSWATLRHEGRLRHRQGVVGRPRRWKPGASARRWRKSSPCRPTTRATAATRRCRRRRSQDRLHHRHRPSQALHEAADNAK
ncbi:MAG: hypothetical protein ACLS7Z_11945 [Christensenellales bacterium]